ncbi:MAG: proton-conducting transporter membrane subunit, partial [Ignavibacteriota bacterium]
MRRRIALAAASIMALGVGSFAFGFFHLVTHAFFKAGLFLGAGSVIHAMHHEQDIRNMGGLRKKLPLTYATFLIASLAISGIPLTSGFLSKDGILASSYAFGSLTGYWIFAIVGFLVALMTAFYMFRLIIITFHGEPRDHHKFELAHESPFVMAMPLAVLAMLSIFIFYTPNPFNADQGWFFSKWINTPELHAPNETRYDFMRSEVSNRIEAGSESHSMHGEITYSEKYTEAMHSAHYPAMFLSLIMAVGGILTAFVFYQWKKVNVEKLAASIKPLYNFSLNKWYFDELYQKTFVAGLIGLTKVFYWFDATIVDGIVNGSAEVTRRFAFFTGGFDKYVVDGFVNLIAYISGFIGLIFRRVQTGKVQTYIVLVIFSIIILLFLF